MQICVINKHYDSRPGEYIGRPSVLGNPFVLGEDGNREEVVDKYRRWLWKNIQGDGPVLRELFRLKEQTRKGELILICWCKRPDKEVACHGDVIEQALQWLDKKERGTTGIEFEARLPVGADSDPPLNAKPIQEQLSIFGATAQAMMSDEEQQPSSYRQQAITQIKLNTSIAASSTLELSDSEIGQPKKVVQLSLLEP